MAGKSRDDIPADIADETVVAFASQLEHARSDSQAKAQACGDILKNFEKNGGHKKGLQIVLSMKKMGAAKGADLLRAIERYSALLGVSSHDMVDEMERGGETDGGASKVVPLNARRGKDAGAKGGARTTRKARAVTREQAKAASDMATPAGGFH
jgi:hypothetical protein